MTLPFIFSKSQATVEEMIENHQYTKVSIMSGIVNFKGLSTSEYL